MPATPDVSANFTATTITNNPLSPTALSLTVATGTGANYPSTFPFMGMLGTLTGAHELVQCTARASDTVTIVRAQEGTVGQQWVAGTPFACVFTAAMLAHLWSAINRDRVYYPDDYGTVGAGDDTAAITGAISAASVNGGGLVQLGPRPYICQTLTLVSNVFVHGCGVDVTILQLKTGANADLINGGATNLGYINVTNQTLGNGNTGGVANWGLANLTLDGNKANQSAGPSYPLRIYGLNYQLNNILIRNGYTGGAVLDWNGGNTPSGQDGLEGRLHGVRFRGNNGIGFVFAGPHDTQMSDVLVENSGSHGFYIGPHATTPLITNLHEWGSALGVSAVGILCEGSGAQFSNCVAEGSDTAQLVINASSVSWRTGNIYGNLTYPASGVQVGQQAGLTPYNGSSFQSAGVTTAVSPANYIVDGLLSNVSGTNGALWFANDGGGTLDITATPGGGSTYTGTINPATQGLISSRGLSGATNHQILLLAATLALGQSSSAALANGGTINTSGTGVSRVNPTAAVTGVFLGVGVYAGQIVTVINESAFSITFAASGSSTVADGVADVIPALTARGFVWDSGAALWFRLA